VGLVTVRAVAAASLGRRLRSFVSRPLTLLLLGGLMGCSLLLLLMRQRAARRSGARLEHTQAASGRPA